MTPPSNADPEAELLLVRAQLRVMREALNDQSAARIAERAGRLRAEETNTRVLYLLRNGNVPRAIEVLQIASSAAKAARDARKYYDPG